MAQNFTAFPQVCGWVGVRKLQICGQKGTTETCKETGSVRSGLYSVVEYLKTPRCLGARKRFAPFIGQRPM